MIDMDPNALIVQHMLDRQAEIAELRAEVQRLTALVALVEQQPDA